MKNTILFLGLLVVTGLNSFAAGPESCSFNKGNCPRTNDWKGHSYVQDYGYGGFSSIVSESLKTALFPVKSLITGPANPECVLNPMTPVYTGSAVMWNGKAQAADGDELYALQCAAEAQGGFKLAGSNIQNLVKTVSNADELQEEMVFLSALGDVHEFNECQNGLFRSLDDAKHRNELHQNAYQQFKDIRSNPRIIESIKKEYKLRANVAEASAKKYCMKESCQNMTAKDFAVIRTLDQDKKDITELRSQIDLVISRIPLANRDSMRIAMENLIMNDGPVSEDQFKKVYEMQLRSLDDGLQRARQDIKKITVMDGDDRYYCVDRNLKENLYRSGQVDHTLKRLGLDDGLKNFKLRSQNRYGLAGTVITEVAMIPTYFVGYGTARLALRAGASSVKAVSTGGRALASGTRAAMLGLEAADYGSGIAHAMADCKSDDFFAQVDGKSCNPLNELGQAYQESSLAQCLTSAAIPFASAFIGTAARTVHSSKLQKLYDAAKPADEIVVVAKATKALSASQKKAAEASLKAKGITSKNIENFFDPKNPIALTDHERIYLLEKYLKVGDLTPDEAKKLLELHNVGSGYGQYSVAELRKKAEGIKIILADHGVTDPTRVRRAINLSLRQGVLGEAAEPASINTAMNAATAAPIPAPDMNSKLTSKQWVQTQATLEISPAFKNLPEAITDKMKQVRIHSTETPLTPVTKDNFNFKNGFTNDSGKKLSQNLPDEMQDAHMRAIEMMGDTGKWTNYFEVFMGEVFQRMLNSGDEALIAAAKEGKYSRAILMKVFTERFEKRGLTISEIPPGVNILGFDEFRAYLRKGPIWDRAFEDGYLSGHGPFPHLFQLDYLFDEMVIASKGKVKHPQEFLDFWGGSDKGLSVWNDTFDLFSEKSNGLNSLRDTNVVTNDYLGQFSWVP